MKKDIYATDPEPEGKNGLTSRAIYVQRKKYKQVFNDLDKIYNQNCYIDLLNVKNNIYKTKNNEPINVSEAVLKNVEEDVYAINFVADAFLELKALCKANKNFKNEKFKNLKAKKSWSNLHKKYHDYMTFLFNEFIKNINVTHKDKKIDSFENFILNYIKFLDNIIYKTPFLKSSYFLSTQYSVRDTGFIIDIDDIGCDEDNKKFKNFLTNYEYNEFVKLCKKTNFLIDINCPWRLAYNLFSQDSEKYLNNYNDNAGQTLTRETIIENYFYKTKEFDLENLKNYMVILYNSFVESKPTLHDPIIVLKSEKQVIKNNFGLRTKITIEEVNSRYNNIFWFNIYTHLAFVENKLDISQQQYIALLKSLTQTFIASDLDASMRELNKIIQNTKKCQTKGEYIFSVPSQS
jgi:hypothetical protein